MAANIREINTCRTTSRVTIATKSYRPKLVLIRKPLLPQLLKNDCNKPKSQPTVINELPVILMRRTNLVTEPHPRRIRKEVLGVHIVTLHGVAIETQPLISKEATF